MSGPAVSIVMAAFDAERTIGEAIASVVEQTFPDWELIVVDDGSSDGTAGVVRSFDERRIRLDRIEHSGLPALARNRAIESSTGPLVALLDADDVWRPRKLEQQVLRFEARPEVGVVHTAAELLVAGRAVHAPRAPAPVGSRALARELIRNNFVYSSSVMLRRSLLEEHGLFDPDPRLRGSLDHELWLRLAPHTEFERLDEPLLLYRVQAASMSANIVEMGIGSLRALDKSRARYPELFAELEGSYLASVGVLRCLCGLPGHGRRELLAALRREPWDRRTWKWLALSLLGRRAFQGLWAARQALQRRARQSA